MSVAKSHEIFDRIEDAFMASLTEAIVTIQIEPDDKAETDRVVALAQPA